MTEQILVRSDGNPFTAVEYLRGDPRRRGLLRRVRRCCMSTVPASIVSPCPTTYWIWSLHGPGCWARTPAASW